VVRWLLGVCTLLMKLWRGWLFWIHESRVGPIIEHPHWVGSVFAAAASLYLWLNVRDPELRKKLRPTYALGCKRVRS
jgi:hypothetical protein